MKTTIFLCLLLSLSFVFAGGWEQITPNGDIPAARYGHSVVQIGDAYYLFGGTVAGESTPSKDVYKFQNNTFTKMPSSRDNVPGMTNHCAVVYDNKMVVLSGARGVTDTSMYTYDPDQDTWEKGPEQPFSERKDAAAVVDNGKAIIVGGQSIDETAVYEDVLSYDFASKTWTTKANLPGGRYGHSLVVHNGVTYVIGGRTVNGEQAQMWSLDQYGWGIVNTNGWLPPRANHLTLPGPNGETYIAAGNTQSTMLESLALEAEPTRAQEYEDVHKLTFVANGNYIVPTWEVAKNPDGTAMTCPPTSEGAGILVITTDANGVVNTQITVLGGLKAGEPQTMAKIWQYNSNPEPQPTPKNIIAQVGAIARCHYTVMMMAFDKEEPKVSLKITWKGNTKLRMCALYIPWLMRDRHALGHAEDDPELFGMMHTNQLESSKVFAEGDQTITKEFTNLKRGTLVILLRNHGKKTARTVEATFTDFTKNPSRFTMLFSLGDPDAKKNPGIKDMVQFPVKPTRWYFRSILWHHHFHKYLKETTEEGEGYWRWNLLDKVPTYWPFPAYVKFYLPQ